MRRERQHGQGEQCRDQRGNEATRVPAAVSLAFSRKLCRSGCERHRVRTQPAYEPVCCPQGGLPPPQYSARTLPGRDRRQKRLQSPARATSAQSGCRHSSHATAYLPLDLYPGELKDFPTKPRPAISLGPQRQESGPERIFAEPTSTVFELTRQTPRSAPGWVGEHISPSRRPSRSSHRIGGGFWRPAGRRSQFRTSVAWTGGLRGPDGFHSKEAPSGPQRA